MFTTPYSLAEKLTLVLIKQHKLLTFGDTFGLTTQLWESPRLIAVTHLGKIHAAAV